MPSEIPPPPRLPPPFPIAKDADTEPGIGIDIEKLSLKRENMRLRQERNQARQALEDSAADTIPPPTKKQKTVRGLLIGTKYAVLLPVLAFAGRAAARKWPAVQELVDAVLQGLGL